MIFPIGRFQKDPLNQIAAAKFMPLFGFAYSDCNV